MDSSARVLSQATLATLKQRRLMKGKRLLPPWLGKEYRLQQIESFHSMSRYRNEVLFTPEEMYMNMYYAEIFLSLQAMNAWLLPANIV